MQSATAHPGRTWHIALGPTDIPHTRRPPRAPLSFLADFDSRLARTSTTKGTDSRQRPLIPLNRRVRPGSIYLLCYLIKVFVSFSHARERERERFFLFTCVTDFNLYGMCVCTRQGDGPGNQLTTTFIHNPRRTRQDKPPCTVLSKGGGCWKPSAGA